ncbi:centrosomal protein of 162 kDa-like [Babylonia areolata]|uniref:centrosomal protein of 162 kDa-like n=1 Tax=Babylonia areolata TaxID=304850 RepID=UPI003FD5419D
MARKLSKEDLDATFDAFLKASVSSEDDTEKINELLRNPKKAKPKDQALWWMDDDSDKKKGSTTKSFLKSKKPVSADSSGRMKASESPTSSRSPRGKLAKHAIVKKTKPDRNKSKGGREGSPGKGKGNRGRPSDVNMSKDSLEDISEKSEEHELHGHNGFAYQPGSSIETTRESVTTDGAGSLGESDRSPGKPGFDTLDELAEKHKFFQDLESKANGSLDYSQLNRELSATGTMYSPGTGMAGNLAGISADSPDGDSPGPGDRGAYEEDLDLSADRETSSHQKPSMLSRVSLDSTLNTTTSPQVGGQEDTGSRDTTQDNLGHTLPETLKTQGTAGAMGTNTSREIEELHQALREVGMSPTLGPGGLESRNASGRNDSAPLSRKPTDRSVGQLLQEMEEIRERQQVIDTQGTDVKLMSDYKNSHSPRSTGLHRQDHVDDHDKGGFDNSHTEDTEVYQPVTAVSAAEKPTKKKVEKSSSTPSNKAKTMDERGRRPSRDRYSYVQSSGYGKRSPEVTPRKSHSPSLSPIRPAGRAARTAHASLDSAPTSRKSSLSPSPRRPKPEPRRPSQTQVFRGGSAINPTTSQDEPIQSKYTRTGVTGIREDVLIEELKDLRNQLQEERQKNTRLLAEQATQERESARKTEAQRLEYEEQVFKLKQENFVLAARLKDVETQGSGDGGSSRGVGVALGGETPSREQVARLEKECKEQEELLARFQAENKRLYEEIRAKEKAAKATEEAMFKENQRLNAEMTSVRSQLEQKETELRSKGIITSLAAQQQIAAGSPDAVTDVTRTAHVAADLRECKRQHENTLRELRAVQKSRTELEQHVDTLVMEREMMKKQLAAARQARPEEIKELERRHGEEVERLTRKLKWYAENQELLDKSAQTLRARDEEVSRLKARIQDLQTETGKRLEENKLRSKQKASDAKKIQDLERQIKEMEQIIRRRHPNSLPALMLAAATVPDPGDTGGDKRGCTVDVLEKRIRKLEGELEKKDEESATLLRGMEQKYNAVKFQFEERVADLESQLRLYKRHGDGDIKPYEHPHTHSLALERELDSTREKYKRQVAELTTQVERLTGELSKVRKQQDNGHRSEKTRWQQVEKDLRGQVAALQAAVEERDRDLHTVMATVDRLQNSAQADPPSDKRRGGKGGGGGGEDYGHTELNTFLDPAQRQKVYQPEAFAEQQAAAQIMQENMELKNRVEMLQLERDQQRVDLRRSLAETEAIARRSREDYENQLASLRQAHEKELTRLRAEQAVYNSTSKLASLQSRCDSQEVMVQHLQRQLASKEAEVEQAGALKKAEAELRQKVEDLQDKLREAKRTQAPEMRHFEALEDKISLLTERRSKREQELEALVRSSQRHASQGLAEEAAHWRRMVDTKNLEICKFREELDVLLNVLRELQRQGIKLPCVTPL